MPDDYPDLINALAQIYSQAGDGRNKLAGDAAWPTLKPRDFSPSLSPYDPQAGRPRPELQEALASYLPKPSDAYGLASLGTTAAMDAGHGKYDPETLAPLTAAIFGFGRRGKVPGEQPPRPTERFEQYYHGTTKDFDAPRMPFYVTQDREMANLFAKHSDPPIARAIDQPSGGRVLPVGVSREGFADLTSKADLDRIAHALIDVTPRYNRGDGKGVRDLSIDEARQQVADSIREGGLSFAVPPVIDAAQRAGFNGVDVWEAWKKFGYGQSDSSAAVFNPSNLRFMNDRAPLPGTLVNGLEQGQFPAGLSVQKNPKTGMNGETFYDAMTPEGEIAARLKVHPDHSVGNVWVEPSLQRQGIASALYDYAAKERGVPQLEPGSYQTPEGRALREAYMKRLQQ